jgi:hypothetical protein
MTHHLTSFSVKNACGRIKWGWSWYHGCVRLGFLFKFLSSKNIDTMENLLLATTINTSIFKWFHNILWLTSFFVVWHPYQAVTMRMIVSICLCGVPAATIYAHVIMCILWVHDLFLESPIRVQGDRTHALHTPTHTTPHLTHTVHKLDLETYTKPWRWTRRAPRAWATYHCRLQLGRSGTGASCQ